MMFMERLIFFRSIRNGLLYLLTMFVFQSFAQTSQHKLDSLFSERGELYIAAGKPDAEILDRMFTDFSVDRLTTDSIYLYLNRYDHPAFINLDLDYRVKTPPGFVDYDLQMRTWEQIKQKDTGNNWDFYPTYEAYVSMMYGFEEAFPDLVKIHHVGHTVMGRDLLFAEISTEPGVRRPVPQMKYTSTMHGDETAGFVLSLRLIHHLISNYGHDEQITQLMDGLDIWICPNENPDGTYRDDNSSIMGATRGNANFIDLNRNYPNPVRLPSSPQQAETTAMVNFSDTMHFILSSNFHGGIELVNYPFDSWTSDQRKHADHNWWVSVMQEYVDTVRKYSPSTYMTGLNNGITHGGDWYVVYGSKQDFMNYYRSCREFTLELSNTKMVPPDQLPLFWDYNHRSLLRYMEQATLGFQGLVYDNDTGAPLAASVSLKDHDEYYSVVFTHPETGYFSRPAFAGEYTMVLSVEDNDEWVVDEIAFEKGSAAYFNFGLPANSPAELKKVRISHEGDGRVLPRNGDVLLNSGANLFLSAIPDESWSFSHWQIGDENVVEEDVVLQVNDNMDIRAHFVKSAQALIRVEPTSIDFGAVEINMEEGKVLIIANDGEIPLSIDAFRFSNPAFSTDDGPPFAVMHNEFVYINLMFKPTEERVYQGDLTISSNANNDPTLRISLRGEGRLPVNITDPDGEQKKVRLAVYPNPAERYSMVRIYLDKPMEFGLDLYGIDGRHVGALLRGVVTEGHHEFPLEKLLPAGTKSGIYILRLTTGEKVLQERIILR